MEWEVYMQTWKICGQEIEVGQKKQFFIEPWGDGYKIPVYAIHGTRPGKTLLITAGIHGDEYPGIAASIKVANGIEPEKIGGRILIFPCVNLSGFWERDLLVQEDKVNLNAAYPGDKNGSVGMRIPNFFIEEVFPKVDFLIDLHSGSAMEPLTPCLFFPAGSEEEVTRVSLDAAKSTSIPYLIASSATTGHYSYAANHMNLPGLLLERGSVGLCLEKWVNAYRKDLYLLLDHFDILPFAGTRENYEQTVIYETVYTTANEQGLWYTALQENTMVKKNDLLGWTEDFFGQTLSQYYATMDGIVFYYTGSLAVKKGQPLVAYGR